MPLLTKATLADADNSLHAGTLDLLYIVDKEGLWNSERGHLIQ